MEARVRIGGNHKFTLKSAVMIYTDTSTALTTVHEVRVDSKGSPYLAPGRSLTTAFLRRLAQGLGTATSAEVLPECILVRTPDMIVWWARAQSRVKAPTSTWNWADYAFANVRGQLVTRQTRTPAEDFNYIAFGVAPLTIS